jgi:amino acid adenylation domain-containing protein
LAEAPVTEVVGDRPRPAVQTFAGATRTFELSGVLCARLRELAAGAGATVFMALLAGFAELLRRYTGQRDLVLGTYTAGRSRVELESLIGFFVNTVVLRLDYAGDPSYLEALGRVRRTCVDAFDHQDVPFEKLVEALAPPRDLSRNPLCQIAFQHFADPTTAKGPGDSSGSGAVDAGTAMLNIDRGSSVFDMVVTCWDVPDPRRPGQGAIAGRIEFNTDLYDPASIDRLVGHFARLLERACAHPEQELSRHSLMTSEEEALVGTFCRGPVTGTEPEDVVTLVQRQAAATPDAPALITAGSTVTYAELAAASNRLAHHLWAHGVGAGTVVAVHAERSPHLVISVLALLTLGATYMPLDPSYPHDRLQPLLADARPGHLLTTSDLPSLDGSTPRPTVHLLDRLDVTEMPDTPPQVRAAPELPAYLIYTSGSTGRPKGVLVSRRALANRLAWMQDAYHLEHDDRVLHKTSIGFDVSLWELTWPLMYGAAMVLAAPGRHADRDYLAALVDRTSVTTLHFVPSLLRDFLDGAGTSLGLPSLRRVICSGEALRPELADRFLSLSDAQLHNLYGPTEAAIDVTAWTCAPGQPQVPIGRPISNVSCHVLDDRRRPVPVGVPGELAIGGVALAAGYLGLPELTAERFITHPLGDPPDHRLYLTGDLVRWREDGALDYLGRRDDQVKIRGVRIELGEVDAALSALPGVDVGIADARPDADGALRIVAYLHCPAAETPTLTSVRRHLASRLPDAYLPTAVVRIESVPLSQSGKLVRSALPDPGSTRTVAAPVPPRTLTEDRVLAIWRDVLPGGARQSRPFGIEDDFFELGGHSLLVTQVVARIRAAFDVEVELPQFFAAPTVQALAALVDHGVPAAADELAAAARGSRTPPQIDGDNLLAQLDTMTDEQVAQTLRSLTGRPSP